MSMSLNQSSTRSGSRRIDSIRPAAHRAMGTGPGGRSPAITVRPVRAVRRHQRVEGIGGRRRGPPPPVPSSASGIGRGLGSVAKLLGPLGDPGRQVADPLQVRG